MKSIDEYTISEKEAEDRVNRWKSNEFTIIPFQEGEKFIQGDPQIKLNSFVFDIGDFTQFVERVNMLPPKSVSGVVCRIGIKEDNTPCLIFEAVTGFDPAANEDGTRMGNLPTPPDGEQSTARYDFSYPCPPTCPPQG